MIDSGSPPAKRMRLSGEELTRINKDEIIDLYMKQQIVLEQLQTKLNEGEKVDGNDKYKTQLAETSRRENVLVMRLAAKEQELQQYAAQISHIKKSQEDAAAKSLRQAMLDPAVNLMFTKMKDELKETKDKLEQAQSELSAWKFTPDSQTGKKLMSRCRTLIAENQELGRQLSQGKVAQLEAELALQKKYSEELKESQEELNEFVIQLDEEVEGMQSTIQLLQQQLIDARRDVEKYRAAAENPDYPADPNSNGSTKQNRTKTDRQVSHDIEMGESNSKTMKNEVGVDDAFYRGNEGGALGERNFENSEFVCKEECEYDGEDEGNTANSTDIAEGDYRDMVHEKNEGENTPTYSEHEVIDESRDSEPEGSPGRVYSDNGDEGSHNGDRSYSEPHSVGSNGRGESPMETYEIIDNGSDDERVTTHITSARDDPGYLREEEEGSKSESITPSTRKEEETGDGEDVVETEEVVFEQTNGEYDSPAEIESSIANKDSTMETPSVVKGDDERKNSSNIKEDNANVVIVPNATHTEVAGNSAIVSTAGHTGPTACSVQVENQVQPASEPAPVEQSAMPTAAHSVMVQAQVMPVISGSGPETTYLMNPHFQHLPSTTLAQQQAFMAEQASLMYKTMLAQHHQLAMADDKTMPVTEGGVARTGEDIRTINPLMHGLPYADPSTAFLAQYKAMLAAQQMLMPGPDGKMQQMIAPGSLGLYPGLPLVQPTILPQPTTDPTTNGVTSSWATNTNVSYTPHPLISRGFLGASPASLMMYSGQNLTPHAVTAMDAEKHQGSGDHGPVQNGVPDRKLPETAETNVNEDSSKAVA